MLLVTELLRWWYSDGFRKQLQIMSNRLDGTIDYFSIDLLVKTLFLPFRQISAGRVDGPLGVQFRALVDKLFSRIIGAFVRAIILIIGGIAIALHIVWMLLMLVVWAVVPLLPLIGIAFAVQGWTV